MNSAAFVLGMLLGGVPEALLVGLLAMVPLSRLKTNQVWIVAGIISVGVPALGWGLLYHADPMQFIYLGVAPRILLNALVGLPIIAGLALWWARRRNKQVQPNPSSGVR